MPFQVDRRKQAVAEKAEAEAQAAAAAEREAVAAAAAVVAEAAAVLERRRAVALAGLPSEPIVGDPDAITVMVRMPDGSRKSRR